MREPLPRQLRNFGFWLVCCLLITVTSPATAKADEKIACDYGGSAADQHGCTITWVEHNLKQSLLYQQPHEDFVVDMMTDSGGTVLIGSSSLPVLEDVDQDGWVDITAFTLIGMVNGDLYVFRKDPALGRFVELGTMNGGDFNQNDSGFWVADGRSNCCERHLTFHRIDSTGITPFFEMDVRGGSPDTLGDQSPCDVYESPSRENMPSTRYDLEQVRAKEPGLIADYCALYSEAGRKRIEKRERSTTPSSVDRSFQIVPAGTVFYCRLDNRTHEVTVTHENGVFTYRYGPLDQPPELEIVRDEDEVELLPQNGAGSSRFGYIAFANGGHRYELSYSYALPFDDAGNPTASEVASSYEYDSFSRNLIVTEVSTGKEIYSRECLRQASYDEISLLENRQ